MDKVDKIWSLRLKHILKRGASAFESLSETGELEDNTTYILMSFISNNILEN